MVTIVENSRFVRTMPKTSRRDIRQLMLAQSKSRLSGAMVERQALRVDSFLEVVYFDMKDDSPTRKLRLVEAVEDDSDW